MFQSFIYYDSPFPHYISEGGSINEEAAEEFRVMATPSHLRKSSGSRDDYASRYFLNEDDYKKYPSGIKNLLDTLNSTEFFESVESLFGVSLKGGNLRAELVCDVNGFFQVPHTDVGDKRITWITYLGSVEDNGEVGTDIFESESNRVKSVPWGFNNGLIFVPGPTTWHGFAKGKKIRGLRKALIINFVDNWQDVDELYKLAKARD